MFLYLIVLLLIITCIIKYDFGKDTVNKSGVFWYYTICILLIFIAGFRYRVGGDTLHYFDTYSDWPTFSEFSKVDFFLLPYQPLWYVLAACCKLISPNFYVLQIVQASIVTITSFIFIKKHVGFKFTAILFWYYGVYFYFTMEIMREAICISLWLLAVDYMIQKRYLKFYLIATIAFFFHLTAAILFLMPLIYSIIKKGNISFIIVSIAIITSFIVISMYPDLFINILPAKLIYKVAVYYNAGEVNLFVKRDFLHIIALFLLIQVYKKIHPDKLGYIPFLKLEISILLASPILFYITERMVNYLYIFEIIVLTNSLIVFSKKYCLRFQYSCVKLFTSIIFIFLLKTYYYGRHPSKVPDTRFYNLIVPYETIFSPHSYPWRERIYYYNEGVTND